MASRGATGSGSKPAAPWSRGVRALGADWPAGADAGSRMPMPTAAHRPQPTVTGAGPGSVSGAGSGQEVPLAPSDVPGGAACASPAEAGWVGPSGRRAEGASKGVDGEGAGARASPGQEGASEARPLTAAELRDIAQRRGLSYEVLVDDARRRGIPIPGA